MAIFIAIGIVAPATATAQTWSTGYFRTNDGYLRGTSLEEQPTNVPASQQWQTTDPYNSTNNLGSTSYVGWISKWTYGLSSGTNGGYNSVRFGGYNAPSGVLPGTTNPSLYRGFSNPGTGTVDFTVDFGIVGPSISIPSNLGYTNQDTFGFNLMSANRGGSLAKFVFNPATAAITNGLGVDWIRNGTNVAIDGSTYKGIDITYGGLFRLSGSAQGSTFSLSVSGLTAQTNGIGVVTNFLVTSTYNVISNGALSGSYTANDFETLSLDWFLASTNNLEPGANYMILNTASVIPEPSIFALLGMGGLVAGYTLARCRKRI